MKIELYPETEKLIQEQLERGGYDSASALVNEAIQRLLQPKRSDSAPPGSRLPDALIGVFDSSEETHIDGRRDPLTELIADRLQKQGITVPWRR